MGGRPLLHQPPRTGRPTTHKSPARSPTLPASPSIHPAPRFFDAKKWHNLTVVSDLGSRRTANISSLWASQDLGIQF